MNSKQEHQFYIIKAFLTADLDENEIGSFASCLDEHALSTTIKPPETDKNSKWQIEWMFKKQPDRDILESCLITGSKTLPPEIAPVSFKDLKTEIIVDRDWLEYSYKQVEPFEIGQLFIYDDNFKAEIPQDKTGIQINAANAFGSGEHGTTKGCLQALLAVKKQKTRPNNILDLGTGSGILAIVAAKLWPEAKIIATDIEEDAINAAQSHCTINQTLDIECFHADGFAAQKIQLQKPYEIIIANILAGTLKGLAHDIADAAAQNGIIILSGIIEEQVMGVIEGFGSAGFTLLDHIQIDEWSTITMGKV